MMSRRSVTAKVVYLHGLGNSLRALRARKAQSSQPVGLWVLIRKSKEWRSGPPSTATDRTLVEVGIDSQVERMALRTAFDSDGQDTSRVLSLTGRDVKAHDRRSLKAEMEAVLLLGRIG